MGFCRERERGVMTHYCAKLCERIVSLLKKNISQCEAAKNRGLLFYSCNIVKRFRNSNPRAVLILHMLRQRSVVIGARVRLTDLATVHICHCEQSQTTDLYPAEMETYTSCKSITND